jgi:hypothetical protein
MPDFSVWLFANKLVGDILWSKFCHLEHTHKSRRKKKTEICHLVAICKNGDKVIKEKKKIHSYVEICGENNK